LRCNPGKHLIEVVRTNKHLIYSRTGAVLYFLSFGKEGERSRKKNVKTGNTMKGFSVKLKSRINIQLLLNILLVAFFTML